MLRLRGFELYSRWVPLPSVSVHVALKIALRSLDHLACENIRFSSLVVAEDVSRGATKSEEKRMFSQAIDHHALQ